ncbi:hypothetical protein TARUN_6999 [Trichoderma arundinaceum]|uniref:Uncharacterized protein n=1 Tax=Trichoderma arundinaceum TaxID=490622 RepID=A0A395NHD5_TRIAR|nr:hypothetical protein TARUN_6999 [Trichoderma arundinaceum]
MDFVKKALHKGETQPGAQGTQGIQGTQSTHGAAPVAPQGQAGAGQQDYVDKGNSSPLLSRRPFAMGSKKAGYNINPTTQEKITDTGRGMYEKATG